jgi:hypothetical protein
MMHREAEAHKGCQNEEVGATEPATGTAAGTHVNTETRLSP